MWCPNCGTKLEDDARFCPECGTNVQEEMESLNHISEPEENFVGYNDLEYAEDESQKGSKMPILIIIAILVVGLGLGIGAYWFVSHKNDKKAENPVQTVEEPDEEYDDTEDVAEDEEQEMEEIEEDENPVDITASLAATPSSMGSYTKLGVQYASATSVVDQQGHDNSADMVLDGRDETSWQEGVDGMGIGEGLTFEFDREYKVKYISFKLGNWRTVDYYQQNNRPKTLEIITDNSVSTVTFPNSQEEYWVEFSEECPTSEIQIVIRDAYQGTSSKWNDTCIAGIEMYGTAQ